jgi:ribonuclease BN (tRNA processing enzyme)
MNGEVHFFFEHLHLDHQLGLRLFGRVLALLLDALVFGSEGLEGCYFLGEGSGELLGLDLHDGSATSTFSNSPKKVDYFSTSSVFFGEVIDRF